MPQTDYISSLMDIKDIDVIKVKNEEKDILIEFKLKRKTQHCPHCQALCDRVHDYRKQLVKDTPMQGKKLIWIYHKRRYRCLCCGKSFNEMFYLLPKYHRISNRLTAHCIVQLKRKCSQKEIAKDIGVSPSTVGRWLKLLCFNKPSTLPRVLSIDEFKGNTNREKFQCILTEPHKKRVFDILPSRSSYAILDYLRKYPDRQRVKYFVMDMSKPYLDIARTLFPKATIVIDRFHVVRYCTWALENVRKRVQKNLLPEERKYFKRSRKLLLVHMNKLDNEGKLALERMLAFSRDLREAYLLKEAFYSFMAAKDSFEAKKLLKEFKLYASISEIPEFKACLTMLNNWEQYILNAFDCPYSNGFTEGTNNTIKVIKRIAYGYRNFDNFRTRILHTLKTSREPAVF